MEAEHDPHPDDGQQTSDDEKKGKNGRRKIKIELIDDKSRRHITFSKRKLGIMKKAWELATLTGTQVLLLVASETGHVYTFATPKLQPLITKPEGKNLIQSCLNAPDPQQQQAMPGRRYEEFEPEQQHNMRGPRGAQPQAAYAQQGYAQPYKTGYFQQAGPGGPAPADATEQGQE